jgi:hypothetical protein
VSSDARAKPAAAPAEPGPKITACCPAGTPGAGARKPPGGKLNPASPAPAGAPGAWLTGIRKIASLLGPRGPGAEDLTALGAAAPEVGGVSPLAALRKTEMGVLRWAGAMALVAWARGRGDQDRSGALVICGGRKGDWGAGLMLPLPLGWEFGDGRADVALLLGGRRTAGWKRRVAASSAAGKLPLCLMVK